MKKLVLFSIGALALTLLNAQAQNTVLYGTFDDWQAFDGVNGTYTVEAVTNFSYGDITINGLGDTNSSAIGATGTEGALEISPVSPFSWSQVQIQAIGGQSTPFFEAMDGPFGSTSSLVDQAGTAIVDFTMPDDTYGGTYFHMGLFINYAGGWGWSDATSQADLGPVNTPYGTQEMYEAVIPYNIAACTLYYWEIGFVADTDYSGENPWYITSFSVVPIPSSITPAPVYSLFSTSNDFNMALGDSSATLQADNTWSETNDVVINGLGNTNSAGGAGIAGSLLVNWIADDTRFGPIIDLPNEGNNPAFLQAIDPGYDPVTTTSAPAYGNVYVDFTQPDTTDGGSYFQLGISFSYAANGYGEWSPFFWSKSTDLGYQDDNGDEVYRATIPYTITGGGPLNYGFTPYIFVNSDYEPANPFHIANISVSSAAAPLITKVNLQGTTLIVSGTNGLTGDSYSLFSSTNIALPPSQWKLVGTPGTLFTGPTFSITNTVNPAGPSTFYCVKAGH